MISPALVADRGGAVVDRPLGRRRRRPAPCGWPGRRRRPRGAPRRRGPRPAGGPPRRRCGRPRPAAGPRASPAAQPVRRLGHRVHEGDRPLGVGDDDGVADAGEPAKPAPALLGPEPPRLGPPPGDVEDLGQECDQHAAGREQGQPDVVGRPGGRPEEPQDRDQLDVGQGGGQEPGPQATARRRPPRPGTGRCPSLADGRDEQHRGRRGRG